MHRRKISVATVMAGQRPGIKEASEGIWLTSFMHHDLGYAGLKQETSQTIGNLFGTSLLPVSRVCSGTHVSGTD